MEISTTFDGTNGDYGAMVDIKSVEENRIVRILSLDFHASIVDPNCPVLVYSRNGGHVGHQSNHNGWILVANATVKCAGYGERTLIPESAFSDHVALAGGQTLGLYITLRTTTPSVRYANGPILKSAYASSNSLQILSASGVGKDFGDSVYPRVWNGAVHYALQSTGKSFRVGPDTADGCLAELETTYDDNLGSYGNLFNIVTRKPIKLFGLDIYTDRFTPVRYELYTKSNSFQDEGGSSSLAPWSILSNGTVTGQGFRKGTPIRGFDILDLPADTTQAFYITLTTPDLRYRNTQSDLPDAVVGDPFSSNEDLEIQIGMSVGQYPLGPALFGPRLWSGTVHYTQDQACPSSAPTERPSSSPSTQPTVLSSSTPSTTPTERASSTPSVQPVTNQPSSSQPSIAPTNPFSTRLSLGPTSVAADIPVRVPSDTPTTKPSLLPSKIPSSAPTASPSFFPTVTGGTHRPTEQPEPSSLPSHRPSMLQSGRPSNFPSLNPSTSAAPSLPPPALSNCTMNNILATQLDGDTGAFGNMFTVTSGNETIQISSISVHTDFSSGTVTALVYVKEGGYLGFENDPVAWRKVAESTVLGNGAGKPTMIPREHFDPITMGPDQTIALYVTLDKPDIRYTRTATPAGNPVASSAQLSINAGAGLADYPFATEFFMYQPRVFNGLIHYASAADCYPLSDVGYAFNVHHSGSISQRQLTGQVASSLEQVVIGLVESQPTLRAFKQDHAMSVHEVRVTPTGGGCAPINPQFVCTPLNTQTVVRHAPTISTAEITFEMLMMNEEITMEVNRRFQAQYVGNIPVSNDFTLELVADTAISEMTESQKRAFERATLKFLRGPLDALNINVLGATVSFQSVTSIPVGNSTESAVAGRTQDRLLQRDESAPSSSSLTVSTTITGEYRPPPYIDFDEAVEDAIDADPGGYEQRIKREDKSFEVYKGIESIRSRNNATKEVVAPRVREQSQPFVQSTWFIVVICVAAGAVVLVVLFLLGRRKEDKSSDFAATGILGYKSEHGGLFRWLLRGRGQETIEEAEVEWAQPAYATADASVALDRMSNVDNAHAYYAQSFASSGAPQYGYGETQNPQAEVTQKAMPHRGYHQQQAAGTFEQKQNYQESASVGEYGVQQSYAQSDAFVDEPYQERLDSYDEDESQYYEAYGHTKDLLDIQESSEYSRGRRYDDERYDDEDYSQIQRYDDEDYSQSQRYDDGEYSQGQRYDDGEYSQPQYDDEHYH